MIVTTFQDAAASTAIESELTLEDLRDLVVSTKAASKEQLPWLKLVRFGMARTAKGSLRHGANVKTVSGVECDYDGKEMDVADAALALRRAGIRALVFSSPSYTPDAPKWRVLCPLSREVPGDMRADLVARVNGVLGGVLARESFTLAQAYYFGWTPATVKPVAMLVPGEPLDTVRGLEPVYPAAGLAPAPVILPTQGTATEAEHVRQVLAAALDVFQHIGEEGYPPDRHAGLLAVSLALAPFILSGHLDTTEAQEAAAAACEASGRTPNGGEVESVFAGALSRAVAWRPPTGGTEFVDGLAVANDAGRWQGFVRDPHTSVFDADTALVGRA